MLTELDRQRYPRLTEISDSIASKSSSSDRLKLCEAMLRHFSSNNNYKYTLDFRQIDKDHTVDPVEDFVRNHRTGHCQLYASALVLMLRAQGVPSRYIVGFHGGDYNKLTDCYVIHGTDAHAWVEAYIPPDECTSEMFDTGIAGSGGAWITLDPTPAVDSENSSEALDLARSIWQDYVISPDENKQAYSSSNRLLMASSGETGLGRLYENTSNFIGGSVPIQFAIVFGGLLFIGFVSFRNQIRKKTKRQTSIPKKMRSLLAKTFSVVSPALGQWIRGGSLKTVPFYQYLEKVLNKHCGLLRQPNQTQREFAIQAGETIAKLNLDVFPKKRVENVLQDVTDAFYLTRFGAVPLDKTAIEQLEKQIRDLEHFIKSNN